MCRTPGLFLTHEQCDVEKGQMSSVETGQMSAVETGQMSAAETTLGVPRKPECSGGYFGGVLWGHTATYVHPF